MRPEFGCAHARLRLRAGRRRRPPATIAYEVRAWRWTGGSRASTLDDVDVALRRGRRTARCYIDIQLPVLGTNDPRNLVFPFYVIPRPTRQVPADDRCPLPNLDDRRFQDLVDDAKRLVQQRCPEWTDHNVSDPGVTLIETFAFMVDQLLYRLNRVPDRLYVTFLDLLGVTPASRRPPRVADVTFWLSAPQDGAGRRARRDPGGHAAHRARGAVVFATTRRARRTVPVSLAHVMAQQADGTEPSRPHRGAAVGRASFRCFGAPPRLGDALLFGLDDAGARPARCALRFECDVAGRRRRPRRPAAGVGGVGRRPAGAPARSSATTTGGLNRAGDVVVHVPARATWPPWSTGSAPAGCAAGSSSPRGPARSTAPPRRSGARRRSPSAARSTAVHAEMVARRDPRALRGRARADGSRSSRGPSSPADATARRRGRGRRRLGRRGPRSTTSPTAAPDDQALRGRPVARRGRVRAGGAASRRRAAPATARCPPKGAPIRLPRYRTGGGRARQRRRRALISVLRTSIPFVSRVENRRAATGGVDGETIESAKVRGPLALRTRDRAVTAEDYEQLAREAAPGRRRGCGACRPATAPSAGSVRVLVVPAARGRRARAAALRATSCPARDARSGSPTYLEARRGHRRPAARSSRPSTRASRSSPSCSARGRASTAAGCGRRRSRRCTATSTRSPAAPTAPAGRSAGRCRPARCSPCCRLCRAPSYVEDVRLFGADPITGRARRAGAAHRARAARARVLLRAPGARRRRGADVRGIVAGLASPHPIARAAARASTRRTTSPQRFTGAFDEVARAGLRDARQASTAYFDPWLAPDDFLDWLAGWVGVELDEDVDRPAAPASSSPARR